MKGVFLDRGSLAPADLDFAPLETALRDWSYYDETSFTDTAMRATPAQVVVSNKVVLDGRALASAPRLELICVAATGTNNVDLDAAAKRGITVCNVRGYATSSVVEHVFSLILALCRHLPQYGRAVAAGEWQRSPHFCLLDYPIAELRGKKLGIVGYGELGHGVANVAKAFGMTVLISARRHQVPTPGREPFDKVLSQADVLSLHCPLTAETRGLIGAAEIGLMKSNSLLINTARGGIVDESALAAALCQNRLGGAGVDVLSKEPPGDNNPLLTADMPNLIVTPHIAWASQASRQRLLDGIAENITAYQQGQPRNVVC